MTAATVNDNIRTIDIIGYDSGWGCANYGCEDGPEAAPVDQIMAHLRHAGYVPKWHGPLGIKRMGDHAKLTDKHATLPVVTEGLQRLTAAAMASAQQNHIPLVLGGDHSCAIGTWSGIVSARQAHGRFGLVWIDAHMDSHTHETAHEGKWGGWWHGQPVAALHGMGLTAFTSLGDRAAKLSPSHVSLIGIHSYEPAELAFAEQQGIRVYMLDEVKRRGFGTVFAEAQKRAQNGTDGWGMTIDLDAFHPDFAPGVGTDEDDGLLPESVFPILRGVAQSHGFSGLEIAEFNPHRDRNHKTANLVEKLVENIFTPAGPLRHTER